MDNQSSLRIETWPIDKALKAFWINNPRFISEEELNNLQALIREFGFILPAIVNSLTGNMIAGHQRTKAASREGLTEIPVILLDLDEGKEATLNLALNKIEGKWDFGLLAETINELASTEEIKLTGFSETDLIALFAQESEAESFEEFAARHSANSSVSEIVYFRSLEVSFSCRRSSYDTFVHNLYKEYGADDAVITAKFFDLIGLKVA